MDDTQTVVLGIGVASDVALTFDAGKVRVTHPGGTITDPVWVRLDGTTAVIAATECHLIPPGATRELDRKEETDEPTPPVSLICAVAVTVQVEGIAR